MTPDPKTRPSGPPDAASSGRGSHGADSLAGGRPSLRPGDPAAGQTGDTAPVGQHAAQNDPDRRDGVDADPITLSGQKARQAGSEWTPIRVLVFGLALAALAFVISYIFGD